MRTGTQFQLVVGFVVVCVGIGALVDGTPYFPIEVSRACAGQHAAVVFATGAILLALAFDRAAYSKWVTVAGVGFVVLAVVSDKISVRGHGVGVFLLGVAAIGVAAETPRARPWVTICALVYSVRVLGKFAAVLAWEAAPLPGPEMCLDIPRKMALACERAADITFGRGAAPHPSTLAVFRACAVCQWLLLLLLLHTLLYRGARRGVRAGPMTR